MAKYYLNGKLTDTTPALDTTLAELDAASKIIKDANIAEKAASKIKKASGKQKLLDLGLSEAEVKALTGA